MGEVWEGPGIPGLSRFEVVGRGGFSVVYRAWQEGLDRPVAVKVLLADLSDPGDARRFQRECAVLGRLGRHRHVVDVYEVGITRDRRPFIVMRFYPGGTLAGRLGRDGPVPAGEAVGMLMDLAGAVQAGHDQGVVHRDIKPENVLIDEDGQVVLADFGIAALVQEGVTRTGSAAFSEGYAAPEVLEENSYGVASDVYSLAATGYALLSGQAPFHDTSGTRRLLAISSTPPAPITTAGVPAGLAAVVTAAMAKDPVGRPGSASEFAAQVQAALAEAGPDAAPTTAGLLDAEGTQVVSRAGGFCRYCGAALTGSGTFCPACGQAQGDHESARTELRPAAATAVGDAPDPVPVPRAGTRRVGLAGLAAVLVLVLGVAAAVYAFGVRPARTTTASTPTPTPTDTATTPSTTRTVTATPKATTTITASPRTTRTVAQPPSGGESHTVCQDGSTGQPNYDFPFESMLSTAVADTSDWQIRDAVTSVQEILRDAGYKNRVGGPVYVDGVFGPATAYAVRQFQEDGGLIVDGEVGAQTWRALAQYC